MVGMHGRSLHRLGRWSPTLFLLGGVLLVGYAALNGMAAATDESLVLVEDVLGPAGFLLGFVGALGHYPGLVDRNAGLARLGALCLLVGTAGFAVITVHGIGVLAGVLEGTVPLVLLLVVAVGMVPGYASFAVASLRDVGQPRTVGLLLALPAFVFATMLSQPFVYGALGLFTETTMAWSNFGISSLQAFAHLAIGYALRDGVARASHALPAPDGTPG